jgi:hypothetical protein
MVFEADKPIYYRLYQLGQHSYLAENINEEGRFHFRKLDHEWIADNEIYQRQVEQIGETIETEFR